MYTNEEQYSQFYRDDVVPQPYEEFEDMAIAQLEKYCPTFPSEEQYNALPQVNKTYITKAILYTINHIYSYPQKFAPHKHQNISSVRIGKFNISGSNIDVSLVDDIPITAAALLRKSGQCSYKLDMRSRCL